MPDPKIYEKQRREKLDKLYDTLDKTSSINRKANIIWQWIKTDVITYKEFEQMLSYASLRINESYFED